MNAKDKNEENKALKKVNNFNDKEFANNSSF